MTVGEVYETALKNDYYSLYMMIEWLVFEKQVLTMEVKPETVKYYLRPAYKRKVEKRKRARNYITVIRLEDEE